MTRVVPVALFAYSRPTVLQRSLEGLRQNAVPLIYAFSDGPADERHVPAVNEVRRLLRAVDWCDIELVERDQNLGLGTSILRGVTEVLQQHDCIIVSEDDLVCVPGTYAYMCAALDAYRDDERVMSVAGWTHEAVTPAAIGEFPYFDGRAECWLWGAWTRSWSGMDRDALTLKNECEANGIDPYLYGADLVHMARIERERNIWAVRFLYLHLLRGGLCVRPPWSLVSHIGDGPDATNRFREDEWANSHRRICPPIPGTWPEPKGHPECATLWQRRCGSRPLGAVASDAGPLSRVLGRLRSHLSHRQR